MIEAPLPPDEAQRLAALRRYDILDTPPEPPFDELTDLAAAICQAPIALISLIDERRQWFKSRVGLAPSETERRVAFCAHALLQPGLLVVEDARRDPRFTDNPLVTRDPGIRFYAGVPLLTPEGDALGTLCVIDRKPRRLAADHARVLRVLSRHVMALLELRRRDREAEALRAANVRLGEVLRQEQARYPHDDAFLAGEPATGKQGQDRRLEVSERSRLALLSMLEDQQLAASALLRSENRFRTLATVVPVGIFRTDTLGHCFYVNPRLCVIMRMARDDVLAGGWRKAVHPDDRVRAVDEWRLAVAARQPFDAEYRLVTPAGGVTWVLERAQVEYDAAGQAIGYVGTLADVTRFKDAEAAARASQERYRYLFEQNPAPMFIYARSGLQILAVNEAFVRHYGYPREQALALRLTDLYPADERQAVAAAAARMRGYADLGEWHHLKRDGTAITTVASTHDLEFGGRDARVAVITDITVLKRAELALRELNAVLEDRVRERTAELAAANAEMEAFIYAVSHDLRAPLRAIQGFERALVQDYADQLPGGAREFLDEIQVGSRRMGALIEGLLELSRGTRGTLERAPVALDAVLSELQTRLAQAAPHRRVDLQTRGDLRVRGDPRLLRTLLQNLLDNAWKYTAGKEHAEISVSADTIDGERIICIEDNGAGFDPAFANRLFEPFQRLHHHDEFPGIGIGLATVARIVRRHGGWIKGTGQPGKGARFCFTLDPAKEGDDAHSTAAVS